MSYGVRVLASNIEANIEIGLGRDSYFTVGDVIELREKMCRIANTDIEAGIRKRMIEHAGRYSWGAISESTYKVYQECLADGEKKRAPPINRL